MLKVTLGDQNECSGSLVESYVLYRNGDITSKHAFKVKSVFSKVKSFELIV